MPIWAGEDQYGQHHKRGSDQGEDECPEEAQSAVNAEKSSEDAK
jgi:hypothetical protein